MQIRPTEPRTRTRVPCALERAFEPHLGLHRLTRLVMSSYPQERSCSSLDAAKAANSSTEPSPGVW